MASRSKTLAAAIVAAIQAFSGLPSGVEVKHVRNVRHLVNEMPENTTATIAVICSEVSDQSVRGSIEETLTMGVVTMANCSSDTVSASDTWDELTEKLRDHLRSLATLKTVTVATDISAVRKAVETPVVCDADILDQDEVFVSVTTLEYTISVGNRS